MWGKGAFMNKPRGSRDLYGSEESRVWPCFSQGGGCHGGGQVTGQLLPSVADVRPCASLLQRNPFSIPYTCLLHADH